MILRSLSFSILLLSVAGCSLHPIPDQVVPVKTADIVLAVRCEARRAIEDEIIKYLDQDSPAMQSIAQELREDPRKFERFDKKRLSESSFKAFDKYVEAAIAYDFSLDMTEMNAVDTNAGFGAVLYPGAFGLAVSQTNLFRRNNIRNFQIADKFGDLVNENPRCAAGPGAPANYIYPISGRVGLDEVIETFIALNEGGSDGQDLRNNHLIKLKDGLVAADAVPVFSDTLTFQTKIFGSVSPSVLLSPLGHALSLASASILASKTRDDSHKIIVSLSLKPKGKAVVAPKPGLLVVHDAPAREPVEHAITTLGLPSKPATSGRRVSVDPKSKTYISDGETAKGRALRELNYQVNLNILRSLRTQ